MARRSALILLGATLVALAASSPAMARSWTQITGTDKSNINEVTLARTADSVLHVAWTRPTPGHTGSEHDLVDRTLSPGGALGPLRVIADGWSSLENPALVATGGKGLDLFVAAIRSLNPTETISNLAFFSSANGGTSWMLQPFDVTSTGAPSDMSAAVGSDGTPFEAWGSSTCLCVHRGTSSANPNHDFQVGLGHYGYEPGMARDPANGHLITAWYSNGNGHHGIYAAVVDQSTGARVGTPMQMPDTSNLAAGPYSGRTPIVGRPGGGVYVAYEGGYPTENKVMVWKVGASHSIILGRDSRGVESVGVASTPAGRLWVFWATNSSSDKPVIHARRSNATATRWGNAVTIKPPKGASSSWNLVGNGQAGPLDLVGSFTIGVSSRQASWYTQVRPGLTLKASKHRLKTGTSRPEKVTFTVLDVGAPVKGAVVKVRKVSATSSSAGKVTLALGPFQHKMHLKARASARGYAPASLTLRVS